MDKTRFTLCALALAGMSSLGWAQAEAVPPSPADLPAAAPSAVQLPPLARDEVKDAVQAARQDGSLNRYDADSRAPDASMEPLSTADDEPEAPVGAIVVTQQAVNADGKPVVFTSVSAAAYYPVAIETEQPMTRAEVRAELEDARRSGENSAFNPDPYVNAPVPMTQRGR